MYRLIFNRIKRILPRISESEKIALSGGDVSLDRDIFSGNVKIPFNYLKKKEPLPVEISNKVDNLLDKYGHIQHIFPSDRYKEIFDYLGKHGFFSFIIDKKYGGNKLSANHLSGLLTKLSSANPALGVCVMVPNSLGPGELLQHYGTETQKNRYLKKLANGDLIPCFGLTGPHNGSDAIGTIDRGVVVRIGKKKFVDITLNKRYITLAPIANLVGVAFDLRDPDGHLEKGKEGITLCLIETPFKGLDQSKFHNPLNSGFPNGTLKGHIRVPLDNIIGGEEKSGRGWEMLIECLSAGRGISLPASANGSAKASCFGIYHYIKNRKQFKLNLSQMEAIQNKFLDMMYHTWVIESGINLMNTIIDNGHTPSVLSAIMKQQTTERARIVVNQAMDIYGGSGICLGENNFLEKFYKNIPIGITVEGSNTLTKYLIIFGQGLNKSHPYVYPIYESIMNDSIDDFRKNLNSLSVDVIKMYFKSLFSFGRTLESQTIKFALLSNFMALKGGKLKSDQNLCGDMGDILSNIFLGYAVRVNQIQGKHSKMFSDYCINRLCEENVLLFNRVIENQGFYLRTFLGHLKAKPNLGNYDENRTIFREINDNKKIMESIRENIYYDNILKKLDILSNEKDKEKYKVLYDDVIQVGEFTDKKHSKN